jgi:hypothetical protein
MKLYSSCTFARLLLSGGGGWEAVSPYQGLELVLLLLEYNNYRSGCVTCLIRETPHSRFPTADVSELVDDILVEIPITCFTSYQWW